MSENKLKWFIAVVNIIIGLFMTIVFLGNNYWGTPLGLLILVSSFYFIKDKQWATLTLPAVILVLALVMIIRTLANPQDGLAAAADGITFIVAILLILFSVAGFWHANSKR